MWVYVALNNITQSYIHIHILWEPNYHVYADGYFIGKSRYKDHTYTKLTYNK